MADIVTKKEKYLLCFTAVVLVLSAVPTLLPRPGLTVEPTYQAAPIPAQTTAGDALWLDMTHSIDLNHASAKELEALPGIGATLAKRIVAYRSLHGPFQRVEELLKVDGVHECTLDAILSEVTVRQ